MLACSSCITSSNYFYSEKTACEIAKLSNMGNFGSVSKYSLDSVRDEVLCWEVWDM